MNAMLCTPVPRSFENAANFDEIFLGREGRTVREIEPREQPTIGVPGESCRTNLFFGFFSTAQRTTTYKQRKVRTIPTLLGCTTAILV
jgi:hypothetical protein